MLENKKMIILTNKLYIYAYDEIITISKDKIIIDKYVIKGENLIINSLDSYVISITGKVNEVTFNDI